MGIPPRVIKRGVSKSFNPFAETPKELGRDFAFSNAKVMRLKRATGLRHAVRSTLGVPMARFSIGDVVHQTKGQTGVIVAIFTTYDGELRYAVDNEGALEFPLETSLVPHKDTPPQH